MTEPQGHQPRHSRQPDHGQPRQYQPSQYQQSGYQPPGQYPYQAGQNPYGAAPQDYGQLYGYNPYGATPAPEPVSSAVKIIGLVIGVFAALTAVAAFLPWVSGAISVNGLGSSDASTKATDGVLTLIMAVVAGIFGVVSTLTTKRSPLHLTAGIIALVLGLLVVVIAFIDIADVQDTADKLGAAFEVGIGLWLTLAGGIGLAVAGVAGIVKRT